MTTAGVYVASAVLAGIAVAQADMRLANSGTTGVGVPMVAKPPAGVARSRSFEPSVLYVTSPKWFVSCIHS